MKNWAKLIGITSFMIVIVFSITACQNNTTLSGGSVVVVVEREATVTNFYQLDGSWEYPSTINVANYPEPGINCTAHYTNCFLTYNAAEKTESITGTIKYTYSGENIDEIWEDQKSLLTFSYEIYYNVTPDFDDETHSMTVVLDNPPTTLTDEYISAIIADCQINKDRTELKIQDSGTTIILTKQ